jgi:hypothetical protein
MANKTKATTKQRTATSRSNQQTISPYFWFFVGGIVVIGLIIVYFLSFSPKAAPPVSYSSQESPNLPYSTNRTNAQSSTPQSVTTSVSGRYVTLHLISGPSDVDEEFRVTSAPHVTDNNGVKTVKLGVILSDTDATNGVTHNTDYAITLKEPLNAGQYQVEVGVSLQSPPNKTLDDLHTLTSAFKVE